MSQFFVMVGSKNHSNDIKNRIISLLIEGESIRDIAETLQLPKSSVFNILQKFKFTGSV